MPNIRSIDMLFLDELFEMGGGYVLNFSDRTMSRFFAEELNVDIDDPAESPAGGAGPDRAVEREQVGNRRSVNDMAGGTFQFPAE